MKRNWIQRFLMWLGRIRPEVRSETRTHYEMTFLPKPHDREITILRNAPATQFLFEGSILKMAWQIIREEKWEKIEHLVYEMKGAGRHVDYLNELADTIETKEEEAKEKVGISTEVDLSDEAVLKEESYARS